MKKIMEHFTASDGTVFYLQCYIPFHTKEHGTPTAFIVPSGKMAPEDYNWISSTLCRKGYLVYSLYQRGYGSGTPLENDRGGLQQQRDTKEGYRFIVEQPLVDRKRIVVIGHSTSASLVQRLAAELDFTCCIALAQLSDWLAYYKAAKDFIPDTYAMACDKYGGDPYEHPQGYIDRSCLHLADKIKIPVLAISGERDNLCPPIWAQRMTMALINSGNDKAECVILKDTGHFFEHIGFYGDQRTEVVELIVEWLDRTMPAEKAAD